MIKSALNKSQLARELGISRASLYYKRKREIIDQDLKHQIEAVQVEHPDYGHKRIAIHLKMNKKRIRRIMKKYGMKPFRRRAKKPIKKKDKGKQKTIYGNLIEKLVENKAITKPNQVWCTDFTYIRFQNKFIYLATIIDVYTRAIVGLNILRFHNRFLVVGAFEHAVIKYGKPEIIHSDQGSEYDSDDFTNFALLLGVVISMSEKASPWQNGFQESFYSHFKSEVGDLSRFETMGELIEYIYQQVYYYNHKRIHSVLKMTPNEKRQSFYQTNVHNVSK